MGVASGVGCGVVFGVTASVAWFLLNPLLSNHTASKLSVPSLDGAVAV